MRSVVLAFALAVLGAVSSAEAAGLVPLPCTGEKIVWVADLPDHRTPDGLRFDLGYRFIVCSRGEWIGHVGDRERYLSFSPATMQVYLQRAFPASVPVVPGLLASAVTEPWTFWAEWLWAGLIGAGALAAGIRALARSRRPSTGSSPSPPTFRRPRARTPIEAWWYSERPPRPSGFGRR